MKYTVLAQTCPIWKVGESDTDAAPRRIRQEDALAAERYPDDYTGRVISVIPDGSRLHAADVADASRMAVSLDLTDDQVNGLRDRTLKLDGTKVVPVGFDDRWGAVAEPLRANLADPATAEFGDRESDLDARRFDEISVLARRMLPKTEVHTGAGLYEVGPGKTYSTIQSAFDQLWSDQGSAQFTATQYIRVFADTYDENVTPNASFNPDRIDGYLLVLEGDPAASRASVILGPTSGFRALYVNCDQFTVRHMTVTNAGGATSDTVGTGSGLINLIIEDCVLVGGVGTWVVNRTVASLSIAESSLTTTTNVLRGVNLQLTNCDFTRSGSKGGTAVSQLGGPGTQRIDGCTFANFSIGTFATSLPFARFVWDIRNCVFYDCVTAVDNLAYGVAGSILINCIFDSCTTVLCMNTYPEEASGRLGAPVTLRNNCYYNYTTFATDTVSPKTYAEFASLNLVDADGDLDQTDPEMVDPANGDFSLDTGSPCIHAGFGSGVVADSLGVDFDGNTPDIGARSSGVLPPVSIPNAPTITAIVNDGDGASATASVLTDSGSKVFLLARQRNSAEAWTVRGSRTDSGDIAATGFTNNANYESIAIATFGTLVTQNPSLPSIPVGVYITDSAGFFAAIRQAIYDWVSGELGIPTIWYPSNAPQPAKTYAAISMGPSQSPRWDYKSPPDEVNGVSTLRGDREFPVEIQIHGKRLPDNENQALTFAEQLATSLQKGSITALFNAANFAFVERIALTDLSAIGGTEFESRVSLELMFRMAHEDTDTVGVIETVDPVGATYEGG
jgi:hypothetical protein